MPKCLLLSRKRGQNGRHYPFLSTQGLMVGDVKDLRGVKPTLCPLAKALLSISAQTGARPKVKEGI